MTYTVTATLAKRTLEVERTIQVEATTPGEAENVAVGHWTRLGWSVRAISVDREGIGRSSAC